MKRPPDRFGEQLRSLRKARGISAHALSQRLKDIRNPDFISDWERSRRKINKYVLLQVVDALDLSDHERRQLFHLADVRNSPTEAKRLYSSGYDIAQNLIAGLLAVENHEVPQGIDSPPAGSDLTSALVRSASQVLMLWALRSGHADLDFRLLAWPPAVYELGLIDSQYQNETTPEYSIPEEFVSEELRLATSVTDKNLLQRLYSEVMAEAYRRWLLSSTDRLNECISQLSYWSIERGIADTILTMRFSNPNDDDSFRVDAVSCDVVEAVNGRQVEFFISEACTQEARTRSEYVYVPDRVDFGPSIMGSLTTTLSSDIAKASLGREALIFNLQCVVDTIYNLSDAHAWSSIHGLGRQPLQLNFAKRPDALDPGVDEQREEIIDLLKKVERRIRRELRRGTIESTDYSHVEQLFVSGQLILDGSDDVGADKSRSEAKPKKSPKQSRATSTTKRKIPKAARKKASPRDKGMTNKKRKQE